MVEAKEFVDCALNIGRDSGERLAGLPVELPPSLLSRADHIIE